MNIDELLKKADDNINKLDNCLELQKNSSNDFQKVENRTKEFLIKEIPIVEKKVKKIKTKRKTDKISWFSKIQKNYKKVLTSVIAIGIIGGSIYGINSITKADSKQVATVTPSVTQEFVEMESLPTQTNSSDYTTLEVNYEAGNMEKKVEIDPFMKSISFDKQIILKDNANYYASFSDLENNINSKIIPENDMMKYDIKSINYDTPDGKSLYITFQDANIADLMLESGATINGLCLVNSNEAGSDIAQHYIVRIDAIKDVLEKELLQRGVL